jgi:uncharacterized Tic20 family protein
MVVFMVTMIASIAASGAHNNSQPPVAIFVFFPLLWLLIMGFWVMVLITAIMYGIKANRGEWAQYPVIGGWVRRILHI